MKYQLDSKQEARIRKTYPIIGQAEQTIKEVFGVELSDITKDDRRRETHLIRLVFISLCQNVPAIALGSFLNRDHATILFGKQRIEDMLCFDREFKHLHKRAQNYFNSQYNVEKYS